MKGFPAKKTEASAEISLRKPHREVTAQNQQPIGSSGLLRTSPRNRSHRRTRTADVRLCRLRQFVRRRWSRLLTAAGTELRLFVLRLQNPNFDRDPAELLDVSSREGRFRRIQSLRAVKVRQCVTPGEHLTQHEKRLNSASGLSDSGSQPVVDSSH